MLNQPQDDHDVPVLAVASDIYDAILLADRAMVVAEGRTVGPVPAGRGAGSLPNFFAVRQCLLSTGCAPRATSPVSIAAALLECMVGG
jgi:hypothetical protein